MTSRGFGSALIRPNPKIRLLLPPSASNHFFFVGDPPLARARPARLLSPSPAPVDDANNPSLALQASAGAAAFERSRTYPCDPARARPVFALAAAHGGYGAQTRGASRCLRHTYTHKLSSLLEGGEGSSGGWRARVFFFSPPRANTTQPTGRLLVSIFSPRMKFPLLGVFLRKPFADAV